jgi:alpha-tubulin suppressor-like RCC1 family protein
VILTKDGEVWVIGRADEGSLGLGVETTQNQFEWRRVDFFPKNDIKIRSIAVGFAHNLALAEDGRVFAWGSNNMGQLGLGDSKDRCASPQKLWV